MGERTRGVVLRNAGLNLLAAAAVLAGLSCSGDDIAGPTTGSIEITTATSGPEADADGYTVQVDAEPAQPIGTAATLQSADLSPGDHTVHLGGVASNCTVADNPRTVSIAAGGTVTVSFTVICSATTGGLQVSSSTSGPSPDADGYSLTVDGTERGALGASGGITLDGLTPGTHEVGLSGIAGNCQVQGGNPQTVTITAGESATVAFTITCTAPPANAGTLRIATSTTGPDPDPNGYAFAVDGGATQTIGVSATLTLPNLTAGSHSVRLSGVAGNCAVQGSNPRSVSVSAGATANLSFAITCTATTGSLEISTTTTGASPDLDGYTVSVDGGSARPIGGNATITIATVAPGPHTVVIAGLATNCTVEGESSRTVTVSVGQRGTVSFAVSCPTPSATYRAIDLGSLGGSSSRANAINAARQVVGESEIPRVNLQEEEPSKIHAFFWENGVMTDLGTVGHAPESRANDINASGQVVGGSGGHAFLWEKGVMTDLDTLGCADCHEAMGINDAGQVVGGLRVPLPAPRSGWDSHAFLWENGVVTDLGTLGGSYSVATAINAAGQIVGVSSIPGQDTYHAFLWEKGVMTDLGALGGTTEATDINAAGQVVGYGRAPVPGQMVRNYHFLWENGVMTDMATLGNPGSAQAINATGQVVGWTQGNALVWHEGVMTLLPGGGMAWDINDEGQVVGASSTNSSCCNLHATLWTRE